MPVRASIKLSVLRGLEVLLTIGCSAISAATSSMGTSTVTRTGECFCVELLNVFVPFGSCGAMRRGGGFGGVRRRAVNVCFADLSATSSATGRRMDFARVIVATRGLGFGTSSPSLPFSLLSQLLGGAGSSGVR